MNAAGDEVVALISENNSLISQIKERYSHVVTQQQEFNLKLNGFLCLLDQLKVPKRTQKNEELAKEYLELKLGVMCNVLWLCWAYEKFHRLYDSVLLTKTDEHLKMVLMSSLEMLGEIKVWPEALSGRNTFITSYMELLLEKILSLPIIHASFLITEIKDRIGCSTSGFIDCYIQLLKTAKSALCGNWISPVKHSLNFEYSVINYLYADPKYSEYSIQYEMARTYTKCQNYLSASEEYMSLLGSIFTKHCSASSLSQKQDIFTNIRSIIHDAIIVHLKSSQLETAYLLCKLCTDQKMVPATTVESAEDFIVGMKDDVIAMMLTAEVYMEMGKINDAKDTLMRSMEVLVGCVLNLMSSKDAECDTHIIKVRELLSGLLAKVYLQIAECYLKNHLMEEASSFLQRSLELKPGYQDAIMLYKKIPAGSSSHISYPVSASEGSVNLLAEDYKSTALIYLLK